MCTAVDQAGWSSRQGVDGVSGEQNRVTGGLGELLNTGGDVDRVPDQGELELAAAADGAGDHHPGVNADADAQLPAEPLGDFAMDQQGSLYRGISMIGEV